jgi:hypothetical protein
MSAPKRWLDESDSDDHLARDLLRSGERLDPPANAQAQVWAALVAQLPPGAPGGGGGSATGSGSSAGGGALPAGAGKALVGAAGGGMLKSALIGAGSALALIAGYTAVTPTAPPETPAPAPTVAAIAETSRPAPLRGGPLSPPPLAPAPSASPSAAASVEPRVPDQRAGSSAAPMAAPAPSAEPAVEVSAAEKESRLREESRLLGEARDALRRGDAPGALARLDELRSKFPAGMLAQEREALAIEALARSGQGGEAKSRAEAFKKAYPASPHAAHVEALTGEPAPR